MDLVIREIGNSLGIIIPKTLLDEAKLKKGDKITATINLGEINLIIKKK